MGRRIDQGNGVSWSYLAQARLMARRGFLFAAARDLQDWERLLVRRIHRRMQEQMLFAQMKVSGQLN